MSEVSLNADFESSEEYLCDKDEVRLDSFCASVTGLTRSRIENLCEAQSVLVNGVAKKKNHRLKSGDLITVSIPENTEIEFSPQDIPLNVVYEDEHIIVIDKPAGMCVHPAPGNMDNTLVNALLFRCRNSLSGINGKIRPGIVHRLDKDTSGLIICAKTDKAHLVIADDIKEHRYEKRYIALIYGHLKQNEGTIKKAIGRSTSDRKKMAAYPWDHPNAKNAVTHYKVLEEFNGYSMLELLLETGRTHQIRVHLQSEGHPVVADPMYAPGRENFGIPGQCLHAFSLKIKHPITKEEMNFVSPLPSHFEKALVKII